MRRMSLDLETLGTRPGSVVVAVGYAVVDDVTGLVDSGVIYPSLREQLSLNLRVHGDTLLWWMGQSYEAIAETFVGEGQRVPISEVANVLTAVWIETECDEVWGNGPTMDISLVEVLANRVQQHLPWSFRQVRCLRTLRSLVGGVKRPEPKIAHSAQHDAIAQGLWAREMIKCIKTSA